MCKILGFDSLYMANEGKVVAVVSKKDADIILKAMKLFLLGRNSQIIGEIINTLKRKVIVKTKIGGTRIIEIPVSSQLPRIC
ncbi:hypothetical protein KAS42_02250 [bacterium]|nr:hypothetical protein [bacterium]